MSGLTVLPGRRRDPPPVSIPKIQVMARRQGKQPPLAF